jgi:hypothetical protein
MKIDFGIEASVAPADRMRCPREGRDIKRRSVPFQTAMNVLRMDGTLGGRACLSRRLQEVLKESLVGRFSQVNMTFIEMCGFIYCIFYYVFVLRLLVTRL